MLIKLGIHIEEVNAMHVNIVDILVNRIACSETNVTLQLKSLIALTFDAALIAFFFAVQGIAEG